MGIASWKTLAGNLDSTSSSNGLTMIGKDVQLGGSLQKPTKINTSATNTLSISGLSSGAVTDSILVISPSTNTIKTMSPINIVSNHEPWYKIGNNVGATKNNDSIYIMGNVGIGTISTSSKLVVSGQDQSVSNFITNGKTSLNITSNDGIVGSGGSIIFGANNGLWSFAGIKGLLNSGGGNSSGDIVLNTRNNITDTFLTERIRIKDRGNIGFNSNNPLTLLDINGSLSVNVVSITDSIYSIQDTDYSIFLLANSKQTVILPAVLSFTRRILSITNPTSIDKNFSSTIPRFYTDLDGQNKYVIPANSTLVLQNRGGNWIVISKELITNSIGPVYSSSSTLTPTGTTAASAIDYISFNIPGAGVWEVDWNVRGKTNNVANTGIASVLTDNNNSVLVNSETFSVSSTSALDIQGVGKGKYFVSTSGTATYKIRIYAVGGVGAIALSDSNGRSWVTAKRIR